MARLPTAAQARTAAPKDCTTAQEQITEERHMAAALEGSRWPMGAPVQGRPGSRDMYRLRRYSLPGCSIRIRWALALSCCAMSGHCCYSALPTALMAFCILCGHAVVVCLGSVLPLTWFVSALSLLCACPSTCMFSCFLCVLQHHTASTGVIRLCMQSHYHDLCCYVHPQALSDSATNLLLRCSGAGACAACQWGCGQNHMQCSAWP